MPPDGLGKKLLVQHQPLILASASPRRRDLLRELGLQFRIVQAAVEEEFVDGEAPADFACRLAAEKARAVAEDYRDSWVLAADTIVVRGDGIVLGKPENSQEACSMLRSLAGRRPKTPCISLPSFMFHTLPPAVPSGRLNGNGASG
jgi:MAF protein